MNTKTKAAAALILVACAAGAAAKKSSTNQPVSSKVETPASEAALSVNGLTAQGWFEAFQGEKQENERLQSALKAEKAKALGWYKQSPQYKASQKAKSVSLEGHWETVCNGGSCQQKWVAGPAKQATSTEKKAVVSGNCASGNCSAPSRRFGFGGRFR